MGSRIILPYGCSGEFIKKMIPDDGRLKNFVFPSLDDFSNDIDKILEHKQKDNTPLWSAIEQQYIEWMNWDISPESIKKYLAPIVHTFTEKTGAPTLCFPRFTPILDESIVMSCNEKEVLILTGKRLEHFHVSDETVLDFYRALPQVIDYLNLVEEDVVINPSNIGYNPTFGLRIIDYGLCDLSNI